MKKFLRYSLIVIACFTLTFCASDGSSSESGAPQANPDGTGKGGSMAVFSIKGNYLYTVDNQDLHVFQISDSNNPVKVNKVTIGRDIETIYSLDNLMFMGSRNGMFIYDVTNPEAPVYKSQAEHFTACDPVVAANGFAYVTLHSNTGCGNNLNTLMVYNIADVTNPQLIHQRNLTYPRGLAIHENFLIICDDELKIFDVTNPAQPSLVKSVNHKFKDVLIYNNTMYAFGEQKVTQFKWNANDFLKLTPISDITY